MKLFKKITEYILIFLLSLCLFEVTVRVLVDKKEHIEKLCGNSSFFIIPFNVPKSFPEKNKSETSYRIYDSFLGWTLGKNASAEPLYYSDSDGYRCSLSSYRDNLKNKVVEKKMSDVIFIGDSFTHGDEISFEQTWPYYIAEKTGLNVINQGVGGYGIDQALLRYRQSNVKSKLVVLGLISGDFERALTQIYSFLNGGLKTKPMFSFRGDRPVLLNQPCIYGKELKHEFLQRENSSFFRNEHNFHPWMFKKEALDFLYSYRLIKSFIVWKSVRRPPVYLTDDERLNFCMEILKLLKKEVEANGARLIVVLLETKNTIKDRKSHNQPWSLLEAKLTEQGIDFINTGDFLYQKFLEDAELFNPKGVHYSPLANQQIADYLIGRGIFNNLKK